MDRREAFVPRRPRGRAIRARSPSPPPRARPPRPPVRPFEELEPVQYEVTDDMVTGVAEVDQKIVSLAEIYTEIALYRKEVYELKNEVGDKEGLDRSLEPMNEIISSLRQRAEAIRTEVRRVPAVSFEEPEPFSHDV